MSLTKKAELRIFSKEEVELVAQSHQPALGMLPDSEVMKIRSLLRERRDRAQTLARQQKREMRGKASASNPAKDNTGTQLKACALASAVARVNKEVTRRQADAARDEG